MLTCGISQSYIKWGENVVKLCVKCTSSHVPVVALADGSTRWMADSKGRKTLL